VVNELSDEVAPGARAHGRDLATAATIVQSATVVGLVAFGVLVVDVFQRITAGGVADPGLMARGIGAAAVPFLIAGTVGTAGLIAAFVVAFRGYRARWFFWWSLALAIVHLTFVPIGTVLGLAWIVYLFCKRAEFLSAVPLESAIRHWLSIWVRPRATIRAIVAKDPTRSVLLLAAVGGVVEVLDRASWQSLGDTWELRGVLFLAALIGPSYGIVILYVWTWCIAFTGRVIGGRATVANVRAATAWATVPIAVVALPTWLASIPVIGAEWFTTETPRVDASLALTIYWVVSGLLAVTAGVWALVLFLKCLSEVQAYSMWRAIGNTALAGLALVLVLLVVAGALVLVG
jgi:hypothetical protein